MIDLQSETMVALKDVELVPGKKVHFSTVFRWVTKGVRGVRLEAVRLGNRWLTSAEALQRFVERLSLTPGSCVEPGRQVRSPAARLRESKAAEGDVAKQGV
jgi:hypothetical protein